MEAKTYYRNNCTGEITYNQKEAMEWHRNGNEIGIWTWSEFFQEMVERITWEV